LTGLWCANTVTQSQAYQYRNRPAEGGNVFVRGKKK